MDRDAIYEVIRKFSRLQRECSHEISEKLGACELQVNQLYYLKMIDRTMEITCGELAGQLNITKPSVTAIVNKLIALGVVEKSRCTRDKRIHYIKLTEKGRNITRLEYFSYQRMVDRILQVFSEEEIHTFIRLTQKL
ncbi:MarR family winged helix-turn-helix transcriptional regulator [uncultured Desulfobacter sp.]|uniref:MarR family winged helix-turn-helix transcriptional regulator n=1 Tax=uncultured Desulfobacter sp. TaxID=240139 RepID=UPI0029F5C7F9|nr:MarR family winged helix-turn-helix transcriptional regulator [uncultured Desulfobacter sp.]